jgi:hypothetical protein
MSNEADAGIIIDRLLRDADWAIEDKTEVSTEVARSPLRFPCSRSGGMRSHPSPPIFRAMADRSPAVGITNKQRSLLRDSQTAPMA